MKSSLSLISSLIFAAGPALAVVIPAGASDGVIPGAPPAERLKERTGSSGKLV